MDQAVLTLRKQAAEPVQPANDFLILQSNGWPSHMYEKALTTETVRDTSE